MVLRGSVNEAHSYFLKFTKLNPQVCIISFIQLQTFDINPLTQVITHIKMGSLSNLLKIVQSFFNDFIEFQIGFLKAEKKPPILTYLYETRK